MKTAIPTSNTLRARGRGMNTISPGSVSGSHMVAIRDPRLYTRPDSAPRPGVPTPPKMPLPHRETPESSVQKFGNWDADSFEHIFKKVREEQHSSNYKEEEAGNYVSNNTTAQPSAPLYKKAWFPCIPLTHKTAQRLDYSLSTQAVNNNTATTNSPTAKSTPSYPYKKGDHAWGSLYFGVQIFKYLAELCWSNE